MIDRAGKDKRIERNLCVMIVAGLLGFMHCHCFPFLPAHIASSIRSCAGTLGLALVAHLRISCRPVSW